MNKTTYTIFDNYDIYSEENMKEAKKRIMENTFFDENGLVAVTDCYGREVKISREEYEETLTEDRIYNECWEMMDTCFEDERYMLKYISEGSVIAIADLGLWNGRRCGYKELRGLSDVMYSSCDYQRIYVDSNGDLRKDESHHDGSNSILYRYWKDGLTDEQKENFLDKIYNGKITSRDITKYTRKAGLEIACRYGWKVRGTKKLTTKTA